MTFDLTPYSRNRRPSFRSLIGFPPRSPHGLSGSSVSRDRMTSVGMASRVEASNSVLRSASSLIPRLGSASRRLPPERGQHLERAPANRRRPRPQWRAAAPIRRRLGLRYPRAFPGGPRPSSPLRPPPRPQGIPVTSVRKERELGGDTP